MLTCPSCALQLPQFARFCARCGTPLPGASARPAQVARRPEAPVWVLVVVWLATAALAWLAVLYGIMAAGAVPAQELGPSVDFETARITAGVIAAIAASLAAGHLAAAIGLTGSRPWARPLATLVFMSWALTCVGLPLALFALNATWRSSAGRPAPSSPPSP